MRRPLVVLALLYVTALTLLVGCGGGEQQSQPRGAGPAGELHPVAGGFEPDDTKLEDCKGEAQCIEQAFGNMAFEDGPKPALALFDRKMRTDRAIESGCHRIAHAIGSAALARYEGNVAKAFADGSASCWSGYYHGILERSFAPAKSRAELGSIARTVCEDDGVRADAFVAYQCVHGLGHGLMLQTGYDLPTALSICDDLATNWDQVSCTGGVFMENISSSYGFKSKWLRDNNLVYPCNVVKAKHKTYCYLMVTSRVLQANGYDWQGAVKACRGVEKGWGDLCFQSLGRDASGFTRQDAKRIASICGLAGAFGRRDCIYGAARDIVSNDAGGTRAARLCNAVGTADRARCFTGIGTVLGSLHRSLDGRRSACRALTTRYAAECSRGAGAGSA